ncbi:hypothetical protein E3J49_02990 [Candidatus Bathyarchaeota archaeon]|nr:MAG: hypothetical protein E3J49_02990 [Candidatus Bathyarchaeota archaeon]
MERKLVLMLVMVVLFTSLLSVTFRIEKVQADEIIGDKAFASMTLQSDMPVVFVDPENARASPGDNITISVKIFNLTNTVYLGDTSPPTPDTWAWGEPLPPDGGGRYNYSLGNLYGFQIDFSWNPLILDYVSHTVKVPVDTYPDGVLWDPVLLANETVDDDAGTYTIAYVSFGGLFGAPVFNCPDDNATVFEMTFNVIRIGKSHLNITWSDLAVALMPGYMDFYPVIPHCVVNGQFQTEVIVTGVESFKVEPFDNGSIFESPIISGESALVRASLVNYGNITDTYNLTLYWGMTLLQAWENETLEAGERKSFNYTIDESELSRGNHTITATISVSHNSSNFVDVIVNEFRVIGTPILTIFGPFSAEPGDTIEYTTNSTHSDPEGVILSYTWALWGPGEICPRIILTNMHGNVTFETDPRWTTGSWFVTLDVKDNYGIEYNESRPASRAWHSEESVQIIPEFPSFLILPLFMFVSLLVVLVYRRKRVISRV